MSLIAIRAALETHLAAITPMLDIAPENGAYVAVTGIPYQRIHLLPARPVNPELGGVVIQESGFMQVDLCYPLLSGPVAAAARAELVRDAFPAGSSYLNSGVVVIIEETPEIAPAIYEPDRYVVPVRVRYFSNVDP